MEPKSKLSDEQKEFLSAKIARIKELKSLEKLNDEQEEELKILTTGVTAKTLVMSFATTEEERESIREKAAEANSETMEEKKIKQRKISEGISNNESREYVKKLVKDNRAMQINLAKLVMENKTLKEGQKHMVSKINSEFNQFKQYISHISETFNLFENTVSELTKMYEVDKNESGANKSQ